MLCVTAAATLTTLITFPVSLSLPETEPGPEGGDRQGGGGAGHLGCEVTSIVGSAMNDAATAAKKVASSYFRIFAWDFLVLVDGIKKSLGYQKNTLRYHPPPPVD